MILAEMITDWTDTSLILAWVFNYRRLPAAADAVDLQPRLKSAGDRGGGEVGGGGERQQERRLPPASRGRGGCLAISQILEVGCMSLCCFVRADTIAALLGDE